MADDAKDPNSISLDSGTNAPPVITMGETGQSGLIVLGGDILEQCSSELRWPQAIKTYKEMEKDASISAASTYIDDKVSTVEWKIAVPSGYEEELKDHAQFLRQNMNDMDDTWRSFIRQASSFGRYGTAIVEKVYGYRTTDSGSKYNDNLIRIKKLAIRSMDSINRFKWTNNGRTLAGLFQNVIQYTDDSAINNGWGYVYSELGVATTTKFIPRKKFMLFRQNAQKDSPIGESPYNGIWKAWKLKTAYIEAEAKSVAQDANAFKVLYMPPEYLDDSSDQAYKDSRLAYERMLSSAHAAKNGAMMLPSTVSDGVQQFKLDVLDLGGNSRYDTNAIIQRFNNEILIGLFADVLAMGQSGGGSYSMAESKLTVIDMAVKARLNEIKDQLNNDLVPQLFQLNGWDIENTPYFDFVIPEATSLDELGSFIQRISAVGMFPVTPETINWILNTAKVPYQVDDDMSSEDLDKLLSPETTRSGDGLATGTVGNGTSTSVSSTDNSIANNENGAS